MQFPAQEYKNKYANLQILCVVCGTGIPKYNRISYRQYSTQKYCGLACKGISQKDLFKGNKNPNYVHGLSKENEIFRGSPKYRKWRMNVFKRDKHTCVICGQVGGELNADHIKPFASFPDLRLELSNGRTLCQKCHKNTPSYGKKLNK